METIVTEDIPSHARHVIYIGIADERTDADQLYEINYAAFAAARNIAAGMEKNGGLFWTVQSTGGDFGLSGEAGAPMGTAGLAALAKTAMKEWPNVFVKAIDVDRSITSEVIADHICEELFRGGLEREVGFKADGTRLAIGMDVSEQQPGPAHVLEPYDTLLVSGGARGITAHALIALARKQPCRFILLGRATQSNMYPNVGNGGESEQELAKLLFEHTVAEGQVPPSPLELKKQARALAASREIRHTMEQLEQLGSEVCYVPVDITDKRSLLDSLIPVTQKWGPVRGIVHGAGVLADKRIADKPDESFKSVFLTKVQGFQTMLEAVNTDDLKLIAIFSSVAAREGNTGQCDYAMANEVLNKMAHQLQSRFKTNNKRILVKALNWGPWEGGMVTPELQRHFMSQGVSLIPAAAGAELFAEEAGGANPEEVEIVIGGSASSALSLITNQERTWRLEKVLDPLRIDWLDDHQIDGYRVIPIVVVHEWLVQFAQSAHPDLSVIRIENVKVKKGIRISPTQTSSLTLRATGKERFDPESQLMVLDMRIEDLEENLHYTASAMLGRQPVECPAPLVADASLPLAAWELPSDQMYGRRLFHGPRFQVVDQLLFFNAECAIGMLQAKSDQTFDERSSLNLSAVLLDGGLQLARLWGYETYKQPSLPMAIGSAYVAANSIGREPVRCEVIVKRQKPQTYAIDLTWFDQQHRLIAQWLQVEMVVVKERRT
ncbi:MAG: omega-3 polyunsaturated fatty acid synthase subunit, PfaA [Paenibacillus sp.]|nr:omega-3 polyunsaturated fatty acid synthase subunit, PfaA [Paenibacillus sp.]